jgi:hypothetical protein
MFGRCIRTVAVAQLVEHWIVAPDVAGSRPVGHPRFLREKLGFLGAIRRRLQHLSQNGPTFVEQRDGSRARRRRQVHVPKRLAEVRVSRQFLDGFDRSAAHRQVRTERATQDVQAAGGPKARAALRRSKPRSQLVAGRGGTVIGVEDQLLTQMPSPDARAFRPKVRARVPESCPRLDVGRSVPIEARTLRGDANGHCLYAPGPSLLARSE